MSVTLPEVIMRGTFASRPTAGSAGSLYFASDTGKQYRDNGTSWDEVTPTLPLASSSAFGVVKVDGTTITASSGVISASGVGGGGGGLVLLEQHTASASASLNFTAWYSSAYDEYLVEVISLVPATNTVTLQLQMSTNGGSSYDTASNYTTLGSYMFSGGIGLSSPSSNSTTYIDLCDGIGNTANWSVASSFRLFNPGSASLYKNVTGLSISFSSGTSTATGVTFVGVYKSTSAVNAFRLLFSSGNIASGIIRVYGIAKT